MNDSVSTIVQEFSALLKDKKISDITYQFNSGNKSQVTSIIKNYLKENSIYSENVLSDYNIQLKFVPVNCKYNCYEAVSFPSHSLHELIYEDWDALRDGNEAKLRQALCKIFLFIPIIKLKNKKVFNDWREWQIGELSVWKPTKGELDSIGKEWHCAKQIVSSGVKQKKESYGKTFRMRNNLLKQSGTEYIHLRPHGKDSFDIDQPYYDFTNGNVRITKQSFWLNKKFINQILQSNKWKTNLREE